MNKMNNLFAAAVSAAIMLPAADSASAGSTNPSENTTNLEFAEVLRIRLPYGLCEFETVVPGYVVDKLSARGDWNTLVIYMLKNCPALGLPLADTTTASISQTVADDSGDGSSSASDTQSGPDGSSDDTLGTGGTDGTDDDDGDNGHGNDADGHDDSNPGKKAE
ncbi:hypothetical protein [Boseongicola aestuarii]|uniref:Uncharacterized protein n=1 Tax=Boseongicola aestuarii TaxID=1470561 RepID=A0A238J6B8_9RHOB|nr:hypothetical protein [Boseongicola aestuarii]SMX25500.1 hypothetical protein BOA8489_03643 [Boseongicola aestuarii]